MFLHYGDLSDSVNLVKLLLRLKPDEIYHLGAQSHVRRELRPFLSTLPDVTGVGTIRILEPSAKWDAFTFLSASSMKCLEGAQVPQTEKTHSGRVVPMVCQVFSYWATVNYRESYGLFASNGILFNHETPRRGKFRHPKISRAVAAIKTRTANGNCFLGNLDAKRDWDMRLSTSKACGGFFSAWGREISCWLVVKPTACVSLRRCLFRMSILIGRNLSKKTRPAFMSGAEVDLLDG